MTVERCVKSDNVHNNIDWTNMISASSIKNYMMDDPLLDWLKYYNITDLTSIPHHSTGYNNINTIDPHTKFIMEQGVEFEKNVIDILKSKYDVTQISYKNETQSVEHYNMTLDAMKEGKPIIYQGVLHCYKNNIYGSPDILIRNDMMKEIFNIEMEKRKDTYYVVIDIKHSTIVFNCNKEFIRNTNNVISYKGQIYIYNLLLEAAQGYNPRYGFIWGKRTMYTKNRGTFTSSELMDNICMIDYKQYDKKIVNKVYDAINWVKDMRTDGINWKILPKPSRVELYPNMKHNTDISFMKIKKDIANNLGEITNIWWCGYERRMKAHHKKIYSWKDKRLTSEKMGFNDTKTARTIDMILDINRQTKKLISLGDLKKCIDNRWRNFGEDVMEFYIDFETISYNIGQVVEDELPGDFIFMIGLGWVENNEWQFKNFIVDKLEDESENKMMKDMWDFVDMKMNELKKTNNIFIHYTNAEVVFYNKFKNKAINKDIPDIFFYDMYKLFRDNNIVIKGAFNFSLKTIGNAMYDNKMIETHWDSDSICSNGLQAMYLAYVEYNKKEINMDIMNKIAHYNMIDCKIMWEIMSYIRKTV